MNESQRLQEMSVCTQVMGAESQAYFYPPQQFSENAHVDSPGAYDAIYRRSIDEPEVFWAEVAGELSWFKPWTKVIDGDMPDTKWFTGSTTNMCYNCIDRQIDLGRGSQTALVWEGELIDEDGKPEIREYTFLELRQEVCQFANAMRELGVKKGDVVTLCMPMVPELAIAMLACARIGAAHMVIFAGFGPWAIRDRVEDCKSRFLITADGGYRRGKVVPLKEHVDEGLDLTDLVETVVVLQHTGSDIQMKEGRDVWWHDAVSNMSTHCAVEEMDAEDLLFVLYTSGSTGKPKGIMHTTAGYMVYTYLTSRYTFDLKVPEIGCDLDLPENHELYWCTADIGWITGHSYIVYGMLLNGVPTLMYEGAPDYPKKDRFWDMIERHRVTKFYTAPTAIRAFMKWGDEWVEKHDLSSLRVLGSVGEPINPEAWMWYHKMIGKEKCPIVDTWWQTETGGHMITPMPGASVTTPGSCAKPFFGVDATVVDELGEEVGVNEVGYLVVRKPWPSMLRGIYGNRERFLDVYWQKNTGYYVSGDSARIDEDGNFWLTGRVDDVILVSGHNLSTSEIENALVAHEAVVEAGVVGYPHPIKGNGVAAFVVLHEGQQPGDALIKSIRYEVAEELGAISRPDVVHFIDVLPKTRSGKIMRRVLRDIASGKVVEGDLTTIEDENVIQQLNRRLT